MGEIDSHLGAVHGGLQADGRTLIDYARVQSQSYWFTYDEPMPVKSVTASVADHMMSFAGTDDDDEDSKKKKMSRPFGVAFILAGVDDNKEPSLYKIDPSGTTVRYLAVAVGAGGESAMSVLQDRYAKSMTLREAEDLASEIFCIDVFINSSSFNRQVYYMMSSQIESVFDFKIINHSFLADNIKLIYLPRNY